MEDLVIVTNRRLDRTITKLWEKIKATFPLKNHTHTIPQVTGLAGRLNKMEKLAKAGL